MLRVLLVAAPLQRAAVYQASEEQPPRYIDCRHGTAQGPQKQNQRQLPGPLERVPWSEPGPRQSPCGFLDCDKAGQTRVPESPTPGAGRSTLVERYGNARPESSYGHCRQPRTCVKLRVSDYRDMPFPDAAIFQSPGLDLLTENPTEFLKALLTGNLARGEVIYQQVTANNSIQPFVIF